jgi:hypothetical protein
MNLISETYIYVVEPIIHVRRGLLNNHSKRKEGKREYSYGWPKETIFFGSFSFSFSFLIYLLRLYKEQETKSFKN